MNKKNLALIVVILAIMGIILYFENQKLNVSSGSQDSAKFVDSNKPVFKEIGGEKYPLSHELTGISGYLNTNDKEIKISDYNGKVVLVDFWTYTCINCLRTLPYLTS